jgi:hypothetical protein
MPPHLLSRRAFIGTLAALGASVSVTSCGTLFGGSGNGDQLVTSVKYFDDRTIAASGLPQRLLWGVGDELGPLTTDSPAMLTAQVFAEEEPLGPPVVLNRHMEGIVRPYFPMAFSTETSGVYRVAFTSDVGDFEGFFEAQDPELVTVLGIGDLLPAVTTPTTGDPAGVDPICTRTPEACRFHSVSLDEAVRNGMPTVLMVTTPGFCVQVDICGPSLDLLLAESATRGGFAGVNVIHAEVYAAPTAEEVGDLAPIMAELTTDDEPLWYEPVLFVADAGGRILERLDFAWDRTDLATALDALPA